MNEFHNQGACEELINMRPSASGGCTIVEPKAVVKNVFAYSKFYEHIFGNTNNQIAIDDNGDIDWINTDNGIPVNILTAASSNVSISHVNNILVVYSYDDNTQSAFKFEDGEYKTYYVAPVAMDAWIDFRSQSGKPVFLTSQGSAPSSGTSLSTVSWEEALSNAVSRYQSYHSGGLCGVSIVGCTYQLEDGNEVWSSAFVVADSSKARVNNENRISDIPVFSSPSNLDTITVKGTEKATYILSYEGKLEGVKQINVYASRPVTPYKIVQDVINKEVRAEKDSLENLELDKKQLYYIGSIQVGGTALRLDFSPTKFAGDVMPVTAGAIERIGPSVSLNNRFHYYKTKTEHIIQTTTNSEQAGIIDAFTYWIAYVEFEQGWRKIDKIFQMSITETQDFIYPMSGVKRIAFIQCHEVDGKIEPRYDDVFFVEMKNSEAYNYSYAFDVLPEIKIYSDAFWDEIYENNPDLSSKRITIADEVNSVNVTKQLNPFAFDINASYSFAGEIINIVTSYIPISAVQVNQFPITVFTTNGIFALKQGTGEVLYDGVDPLQPMVAEGMLISTPHGIFFVSANNLYLLIGQEAVNVSHALNAKHDASLRDLDSFKALCNLNSSTPFNFTDFLSKEDFRLFIGDASLMYDQLHNELIISNPAASYSYVFNIETKAFHKISAKYLGHMNSTHYAIMQGQDGIKSLVDMFTEEPSSVSILLQSRPFQLEPAWFTHINRLLMFVDASISRNQNLCLSVYGSDNLNDWDCIISSQKQSANLRQIRTNRAAKSYRDYVILITGTVNTDTDIADIIADYTVVNRRLG